MRWQVAMLGSVALATCFSNAAYAQRGGRGGGAGGGCQQQSSSSSTSSTNSLSPITAQSSPMTQLAQQAYLQQMQMQQAYMRQLMMQQQLQNAQAALALQRSQLQSYEEAQQRQLDAIADAVAKRAAKTKNMTKLAKTKN